MKIYLRQYVFAGWLLTLAGCTSFDFTGRWTYQDGSVSIVCDDGQRDSYTLVGDTLAIGSADEDVAFQVTIASPEARSDCLVTAKATGELSSVNTATCETAGVDADYHLISWTLEHSGEGEWLEERGEIYQGWANGTSTGSCTIWRSGLLFRNLE